MAKINVNTSETMAKANVTDSQLANADKQFGVELDKMPKVKIRLPKDPMDESGVKEVCINGYVYLIQRGETVEVPEPVAQILVNAGLI